MELSRPVHADATLELRGTVQGRTDTASTLRSIKPVANIREESSTTAELLADFILAILPHPTRLLYLTGDKNPDCDTLSGVLGSAGMYRVQGSPVFSRRLKEIRLEIVNAAPWSSHRIILPFLKEPFDLSAVLCAHDLLRSHTHKACNFDPSRLVLQLAGFNRPVHTDVEVPDMEGEGIGEVDVALVVKNYEKPQPADLANSTGLQEKWVFFRRFVQKLVSPGNRSSAVLFIV
ncbi:hypothetical protein EV421DRAFT_1733852 [Armillaria borealis]|uniref:Uncharacterized protein n=1 Tax=Armillaria borealis TaxID=47425 RepID=A0AA39JQZ7_9AGAR|nr:hypothetical protein EV421DRAFT_1733852 [Armillaria borealis]